MMHKYIMIKIMGSKKRKVGKTHVNLTKMGGEIYTFCGSMGNIQYA